jgi:hypothetical protein
MDQPIVGKRAIFEAREKQSRQISAGLKQNIP